MAAPRLVLRDHDGDVKMLDAPPLPLIELPTSAETSTDLIKQEDTLMRFTYESYRYWAETYYDRTQALRESLEGLEWVASKRAEELEMTQELLRLRDEELEEAKKELSEAQSSLAMMTGLNTIAEGGASDAVAELDAAAPGVTPVEDGDADDSGSEWSDVDITTGD